MGVPGFPAMARTSDPRGAGDREDSDATDLDSRTLAEVLPGVRARQVAQEETRLRT